MKKGKKVSFILLLILIKSSYLIAQNWEQDTIILTDVNKVLLSDSTIFSNDWGSNEIYIYEKSNKSWINKAVLSIGNMASGEEISQLSLYNETLVVGANAGSSSGTDSTYGSVYLFEKPINGWETNDKSTYVIREYENWATGFGMSVDMFDDIIVIGAPNDNNFMGAVIVYKKEDNNWNRIAKLTCTENDFRQEFGHDIAIDENIIYVGENTVDNSGIYIFEKPNAGWEDTTESYKITSEENPEMLGWNFDANNNYIIAGSPWSTDKSIYIFYPENAGDWSEYNELELETTFDENEKVGFDIKIWNNFFVYGGEGLAVNEIRESDKVVSELFDHPDGAYDVDFNGKHIVLAKNTGLHVYNNTGFTLSDQSKNEFFNLEIVISPNPAHDIIKINNPKNEFIEQFEIISYSGNKVLLKEINGNIENIEIDVSGIKSGIYILQLKSKNRLFSKKIIKI